MLSLVNVFKTNSFYSFLFLFFDIISSTCSVSTQYAKLSNKKLTAHRERSTFRKPLAMRVILVFIIYVALCLFFNLKEVTNRIMKLIVINYVVLVLSFLFANI